jgi:hypothetical protein
VGKQLEIARAQFAGGQQKRAIDTLWAAVPYPADADEANAHIDFLSELREQVSGRVQRRCDELLAVARASLQRVEAADRRSLTNQYRDAVAVVSRCRVLGGSGLPPKPSAIWELVFTDDAIRLVDIVGNEVIVPFSDVTAIEIGGPGARQSGGGFAGGGFGLAGAAEGMLIATALNLLTKRTSIDTLICIQTTTAELFLHHSEATPDSLRIRLSQVFTVLRRQHARPRESGHGGDAQMGAVEQLTSLATMLERGLITNEEFQNLKADVLKQ